MNERRYNKMNETVNSNKTKTAVHRRVTTGSTSPVLIYVCIYLYEQTEHGIHFPV